MSGFICPVCGKPLERNERQYLCKNRHSFDISAKGYVNLLLTNHMNAKLPGDNKLMVNARRRFLEKGFYSCLADSAADTAAEQLNGSVVLDAGCGEGYYTEYIFHRLHQIQADLSAFAVDISKAACAAAAGRFKGDMSVSIAAASVFRLPFADESIDLLVTMFSPYCGSEYRRVLKSSGRMIMAIPGREHLISLKKAIYDTPYENAVHPYQTDGFDFIRCIDIQKNIILDSTEDIQNLFAMTPYYYKTSREGHERVSALERLETPISFKLLVYKPN